MLGLTWELVNFDAGELYVGQQLQRVGRQLLRRETKTDTSQAPLPLPDLCITALKLRRQQQDADREQRGDAWLETGLVFTTRYGTPIEPRNFNRSFDRRIVKAKVAKITVHSTRRTCGSLLATLEVHPRVAMQILRHSKIALTMEIYTEVPRRPPARRSRSSDNGSTTLNATAALGAAPRSKQPVSMIGTGF